MNLAEHIWLTVYWTLYCVLHSLLAATGWKLRMRHWLGDRYRFYRPVYSLFAALSLLAILIYQFRIVSSALLVISLPFRLLAVTLLVMGLFFMWQSIRKYFFYLSGIDVIIDKPAEVKLETSGLHRFVRHPLYFGTLLVIWNIFLWFPSFANGISVIIITLYTLIGTRLEEQKLVKEFGAAYINYRHEVGMLFPKIFRHRQRGFSRS